VADDGEAALGAAARRDREMAGWTCVLLGFIAFLQMVLLLGTGPALDRVDPNRASVLASAYALMGGAVVGIAVAVWAVIRFGAWVPVVVYGLVGLALGLGYGLFAYTGDAIVDDCFLCVDLGRFSVYLVMQFCLAVVTLVSVAYGLGLGAYRGARRTRPGLMVGPLVLFTAQHGAMGLGILFVIDDAVAYARAVNESAGLGVMTVVALLVGLAARARPRA